jgi:hypothetical protein
MADRPNAGDSVLARPWSARFAFGLPAGSVRALLALAILGTTAGLIALRPDAVIPDAFRDLMFLILGHYFALRRTAAEPEQAGPSPLFLPRGSVRLIIIVGFAAVIVILIRRREPLNPESTPAVYSLMVVVGFLLGVLTSVISAWLSRSGRQPKRFWADVRATLILLAAAFLILLAWNKTFHFFPPPREGAPRFPLTDKGMEHLLAAIVAFYFGARS